jgi:site-specific DNA-methyltransferase (adenine-specific)
LSVEWVEIGPHRLACGDCLEVLPMLDTGSVDAVVTDPPYNVGFEYASTCDDRPDYRDWCARWFFLCRRICDGAITLSCGQVNLAMWCGIEPPRWVMNWWKPAGMGRSPVGFNNWEPMPLWGKSKNRATCDVVRACIEPDEALSGHPCPKPLKWGEGFVKSLSKPDMTVLDPFAGSGTVGVACANLGRNFIGIEQERRYFDIACRRIESALHAEPLLEGVA